MFAFVLQSVLFGVVVHSSRVIDTHSWKKYAFWKLKQIDFKIGAFEGWFGWGEGFKGKI